MNKIFLVLALTCSGMGLFAQNPVKENLAWMVGEWSGSGWTYNGPNDRVEFMQQERVFWGAEQTVLVVQSEGLDPESGTTLFEAVGMIYFDAEEGVYRMHSFTGQQGGVVADFAVTGIRTAKWGFDVPGGRVEYRIDASSGAWVEKGSYQADGDTTAYPIFEMTVENDKE